MKIANNFNINKEVSQKELFRLVNILYDVKEYKVIAQELEDLLTQTLMELVEITDNKEVELI